VRKHGITTPQADIHAPYYADKGADILLFKNVLDFKSISGKVQFPRGEAKRMMDHNPHFSMGSINGMFR
jgi:hypothetical protein